MFSSKKQVYKMSDINKPKTVIAKDVYLEAICLTGQQSVRIDGIYKGSINIEGSLVLGKGGSIVGDVNAGYFLVAGEIIGNVQCAFQLHLVSTAVVVGDIQAPSIIIDEGSQVTGRFISGAEGVAQSLLQKNEEILHIQSNENNEHGR
jgi:cytoskeletal protein CcmA (bactofilin family)